MAQEMTITVTVDEPVFYPVGGTFNLKEIDVKIKTFNTMQDFLTKNEPAGRFKIFKDEKETETNLESFLTKLDTIIFDDVTSKEELKEELLYLFKRYKSIYGKLYEQGELPVFFSNGGQKGIFNIEKENLSIVNLKMIKL